jgi:serine/threonine-protein kinase
MKFLAPHTSTPEGIARLRREAYATGQLAHRGIVRVFDLLDLPREKVPLAMVMERLRGRTLSERLRCDGALSVDETLKCTLPILRAVHYAHGIGIIHRDLKPDNVFLHVEPDGQIVPKLLDFGVSKVLRHTAPPVTAVGEIVGTPTYMSPEQLRGSEVDARSDVFCAGILLYTCLTGRSPFLSEDGGPPSRPCLLEIDRTRPAKIPAPLWQVIARALEVNPDDRYVSAAAFADALERVAEETTLDGTTDSVPSPPPLVRIGAGGKTRHRLAAALLAVSAAAVLFGPPGRPLAAASARSDDEAATLALRGPRVLLPEHDILTEPARAPRPSRTPRHGRRDRYVIRDPGF